MAPAEIDGKYFLSYEEIHDTIRALSRKIMDDGFDPDVIVAIGTGGFIPARILKTFLKKPILTVGISYYGPDNKPARTPHTIQWIDEVEKKLQGKRVLLVDEVDDSRVTLEYCLRELLRHGAQEIAIAVLHNKDKEKRGKIPEEIRRYYVGLELEDRWICYPWDALDITEHSRKADQPSTV
ncbi:MAG TPA: phosphoribosyltransferase [Spirochaetia bacterium]|nr:phosphoribosyltransferase [Spirochaetia bacterium]